MNRIQFKDISGGPAVVKVKASRHPWSYGINFLIYAECFDSKRKMVIKSIEFEDYEPHTETRETFNLRPEDAQALMDELWHAGIRPSSGEGSVGQIGATEKHLSDMRKLVEKTLEVSLDNPQKR